MTGRVAAAGLIRAYKRFVSPLLPPACRFQPTCSEYAAEAIERQGIGRGLALALVRLVRCNPWSRGGHDPVPETAWWAGPGRRSDGRSGGRARS